MLPEFVEFKKIPRLRRDIIITEKIDGTNAQIHITDDGQVYAGSRKRWITVDADNYGFARWVKDHEEVIKGELGPGTHFGEWWGPGIQRGYGLREKCFSLFNTSKWTDALLTICNVVPVLYEGPFDEMAIDQTLQHLSKHGSRVSPGFMRPEGIVIFHTAGGGYFKITLEGDQAKGVN